MIWCRRRAKVSNNSITNDADVEIFFLRVHFCEGDMTTYWALLRNTRGSDGSVLGTSSHGASSAASSGGDRSIGWGAGEKEDNLILDLPPMSRSAKHKRLIDWNVEMLVQLLKRVVAQRDPAVAKQRVEDPNTVLQKLERGDTPYEEVIEAIELPKFDSTNAHFRDSNSVELGSDVVPQLRAREW